MKKKYLNLSENGLNQSSGNFVFELLSSYHVIILQKIEKNIKNAIKHFFTFQDNYLD